MVNTLESKPALAVLVDDVQKKLFASEDTVCLDRARLVTEAHQRCRHLPPPLLRARTFAHVLSHMTLDLQSNPVLGGNTSRAPRAWMLVPEFGLRPCSQSVIEHDFLTPEWLNDKVPPEISEYWKDKAMGFTPGAAAGIGHNSLDFDLVVNAGLEVVMANIRRHMGAGSAEENIYREAMLMGCEAVIGWAARIANEAERLARAETDPCRAEAHARVAAACRHVPRWPARSYFEGLQAILLVHLASVLEGQGTSQSIGLPDRALRRFSDQVCAERDECVEVTRAFLLGVCANSFQGRVSKTQALTLGGGDQAGNDACNAVTMCFLEAYDRTPVADPHAFFRWHRNVAADVCEKVVAMLSRGRSMPLLVNDEVAAPGLQDIGIRPADAWNYCVVGCNEIGVPGRATETAWSMGTCLVEVEVLGECLRKGADELDSMEAILRAYSQQTQAVLAQGLSARRERTRVLAEQTPFPFCSALCHGPAEAGRDYLLSMPYRDIACAFVRGTTNAVNALAAIDQMVFQSGQLTIPELVARLEQNDASLLDSLRMAPKWGNDDPDADRWTLPFHEAREAALKAIEKEFPGVRFIACHVIRSLHHVSGKPVPATPDGRGRGEALTDSIGAECGTAIEGPTALLNSLLKIDARRFYKGLYNLNISLTGNQAAPELLRPLMEAFFLDGGQELQVNVLNLQKLLLAREHPEDFQDLVVRIAGLNARFAELSRLEQDEIIRRAEAAG
jgi:pyruvate-formate lyase